MISIIICCRNKAINKDFSHNIENTIGSEYELIVVDNSENEYSIFEAYNLGISKSQGEYLCFMHDDILIHSEGWGKIIHRIFKENNEIGLIGIAGAKVKTKMPSAWWNCPGDQKVIHIIQHFKEKNIEKVKWNLGFKNGSNSEEVVVIDGVFMTMRKEKGICFNTDMKGFHNYDLNISLEYKKLGYSIVVTNEILIEHFSDGSTDKEWGESTFQIHNIYRKHLPLKTDNLCASKKLKTLEFANGVTFLKHCLNFGLKRNACIVGFYLIKENPSSILNLIFLKKLIKLLLHRKSIF